MSILHEVFGWSQTLPAWQSDAVARLLAKQTLDASDQDDLLALLKETHGVPDPQGRVAKPLQAEQIPAPVRAETLVELRAMKNLQHVNAIAEQQVLPFGSSGMTVIYGDNGSGKSGYSRVLKRACRARDQSELILPNANLPVDKAAIPQACFEVSVDGANQDVQWLHGLASPALLSAFSIFDTRCARAYLDNEDDFSYVPYGLDVFEGLAKLSKELKISIDAEIAQSAVDLTLFAPLLGDTQVGKLIAGLSAKTPIDQIDALAAVTVADLGQHSSWEKSLKEANPKEKASQNRQLARRIATVASNTQTKGILISQAAAVLQEMTGSYYTAKTAAALAAEQFMETDKLLPGTGGDAWRELFEAARKFAVVAHPDKEFPNFGAESACPLCQQPLADGADRLMRFEHFIQQEAEKTAQQRYADLQVQYKAFAAHDFNIGLDDVTHGELAALLAPLAAEARAFEASLKARQEAIKRAFIDNQWTGLPPELENPSARLQALVDQLNADADILEQASDEAAREELHKQFTALDARIRLQGVRDAIVAAVTRLAHQEKLRKCLGDLKTNAISLKAAELAEKVVSKELEATLNQEFKALGVGMLQVSLKSRADKGKALHKLKLEMPQSRNPSEILSEGEQRAIAIAAFLAEVALSGGKGGVVFDDPVSSLDHRRRERVAKRLAAEAAKRQVIIFTHDIYFLCLLVEEANNCGVPILTQSLTRRPEGFGVTEPDLPFEGKNTRKRIGTLRALQQNIAKLFRTGDDQEHRKKTVEAYFLMRLAWERAVEEVLLREVVLRFRKGIETQRLDGVVVEDDDYRQVDAGMSKCSNYAHDKALVGGIAVPDPDELLADIEALEAWRARIEERAVATPRCQASCRLS